MRTGREYALRQSLEAAESYDVILIDCPPSLGVLTINGLTAADQVVIPMQCEALSHRRRRAAARDHRRREAPDQPRTRGARHDPHHVRRADQARTRGARGRRIALLAARSSSHPSASRSSSPRRRGTATPSCSSPRPTPARTRTGHRGGASCRDRAGAGAIGGGIPDRLGEPEARDARRRHPSTIAAGDLEGRRDPLGKMALFSAEANGRPFGTLFIECSDCGRETPVSALEAAKVRAPAVAAPALRPPVPLPDALSVVRTANVGPAALDPGITGKLGPRCYAAAPWRTSAGPSRVLAAFAHPDDAEFTFGGTVAGWTARGRRSPTSASRTGRRDRTSRAGRARRSPRSARRSSARRRRSSAWRTWCSSATRRLPGGDARPAPGPDPRGPPVPPRAASSPPIPRPVEVVPATSTTPTTGPWARRCWP